MGGNRQIGHVLWTAETVLVEEDWMGGVVEGTTDVSPEIRGKSVRNRIMASCLNAPQIVCRVTAALNRDAFIGESGGGRMRKTRTTKTPCAVYWVMIKLL